MSTALATLAATARQFVADNADDSFSRGLSEYAPGASNNGHAGDGDTIQMTLTRERTTVSLTIIKRAPASRSGC